MAAELKRARAVAYIRESTEEQGQGFSPDAQREGIRRFAPENDLELTAETATFTPAGASQRLALSSAPHVRRR